MTATNLEPVERSEPGFDIAAARDWLAEHLEPVEITDESVLDRVVAILRRRRAGAR